MEDTPNDTASNPLSDEHLPVGGEVDMHDGSSIAPDISDDMPGEEEDMTDISAAGTEELGSIPDSDGPANPSATE